jgi:flagellar hook assembly protein FlgD
MTLDHYTAAGPDAYRNALAQNYPNPFNPVTTIKYTIKEQTHVSLMVYNVAGQLVRTLVNEVQSPDGVKPVEWRGLNNNGQAVASGVYFYKFMTKDFTKTKKMVLLK